MQHAFKESLAAAGHRFTTQRAAVYEILSASCSHPTADEIFTDVREQIPDISLATVYKALEAFVSSGLAQKLALGAGPARYDARTDVHDHIRCLRCGRVADLEATRTADLVEKVSSRTDFEVLGYHLELVGTCPNCRS